MAEHPTGDELYAWQSRTPQGWAIITLTFVAPNQPSVMSTTKVLIHRELEVAESWRKLAMVHERQFHEPIRLARFDLAATVAEIKPMNPAMN